MTTTSTVPESTPASETLGALANVPAGSENALELYIRKFLNARASRYIDYPYCVHLEISTLCPAACNFCPYPTLERKSNVMKADLLEKILSELEAIPTDHSFALFPCKVSDPFADRRLLDVLRDVNVRLPNARLCLLTNGLMLSETKYRGLTQLENVEFLSIALNDHRPGPYKELMGASFERVVAHLDRIHEVVQTEGAPEFPILISRVEDGTAADREFLDWSRERYPAFEVVLYVRSVWGGQVDTFNSQPIPDAPCLRWFDLSITSTGKVSLCCMDGKSEWAIGDVRLEHSLAVYNKPEFRRMRAHVMSRKGPDAPEPCRNCSILGYDKGL